MLFPNRDLVHGAPQQSVPLHVSNWGEEMRMKYSSLDGGLQYGIEGIGSVLKGSDGWSTLVNHIEEIFHIPREDLQSCIRTLNVLQ